MSGVVNVTEVSMGWRDIPLEGHPMDTTDAIFFYGCSDAGVAVAGRRILASLGRQHRSR